MKKSIKVYFLNDRINKLIKKVKKIQYFDPNKKLNKKKKEKMFENILELESEIIKLNLLIDKWIIYIDSLENFYKKRKIILFILHIIEKKNYLKNLKEAQILINYFYYLSFTQSTYQINQIFKKCKLCEKRTRKSSRRLKYKTRDGRIKRLNEIYCYLCVMKNHNHIGCNSKNKCLVNDSGLHNSIICPFLTIINEDSEYEYESN